MIIQKSKFYCYKYDKWKTHKLAISNWLLKWISSDIKKPKETVCDNSLTLLSAVMKNFTQCSSLQDYERDYSDLLTKKLNFNSHWVPRCFVRIDVTHFIKMCSKWIPLKTILRRVREIILQAMSIIIKYQSLAEVHLILHSILNKYVYINIYVYLFAFCVVWFCYIACR